MFRPVKVLGSLLRTIGVSEEEIRRALGGPAASPNPKSLPARTTSSVPVSAGQATSSVYLLLDTSRSMEEDDKLSQARSGGRKFATEAIGRNYKVGVVRFSDDAEITAEPSADLAAIERGLSAYREGGTNMTAAIRLAIAKLSATAGDHAMVLVTDGCPNDQDSTRQAAHDARRRGITIIAIGTDDADRAFLDELASAKELAQRVERRELQAAIADSARLLPARTKPNKV